MKRKLRWLQTVEIPEGLDELQQSSQGGVIVTGTRARTWNRGEEIWVYVHGLSPMRISIPGIGFFPTKLAEGKHFELVN
jgi:hypothetical protein